MANRDLIDIATSKRYVWRKAWPMVLGVVFALSYCGLTSVAESQALEAVPPGDEIQWATVAIHGFTGHECGQVAEASRLPDGSIRAKCGGEWFRVAFTNGAPVAIKCPVELIDDDSCTAARNVKPVPGHGGQ